MKKNIITIVSTALLTTLSILVFLEIKAQKDQLIADKIEVIHSKILDESRNLLVHLPRNYDTDKENGYPILIALDGTSHDQMIANAANVLNNAQELSEMIIIGIPNTNRHRDLTPEYLMKKENPIDLGAGNIFLSFIEKEVIPMIEDQYNTSAYRMISGHSRGGLFSFYAMLEKPALFDACFSFSPAFWRNDNLIVDKVREHLNNKKALNQFIYLSLGDQENEKMKVGFEEMIKLLKESKTDFKNIHYQYTRGANHGNNALYSVPMALKIWESEL